MNTAAYQTTDKSELSARIFPYLVERGLENITIREVCRGTGIVQGTLCTIGLRTRQVLCARRRSTA